MNDANSILKVTCECDDTLKLEELTEFQGGLKRRDNSDVDKIVRSVKKYGIAFPLFVWKHDGINHVLDGHGRILALRKLDGQGFLVPPLPVVYVDCKDEKSARDLLLRLNSHYGEMTKESVIEFIGDFDIDTADLELPSGVIEFVSDEEPAADTSGDDDIPEEQEEAVSQLGEMYELGNSILMCGDSTNPEDVALLMGGEKADLCFTDPPYGMGLDTDYSGMKSKLGCKTVKNGTKYEQGFVDDFNPKIISTIFENFDYCKEMFLWGADYYAEMLEEKNSGSWIVWDKRASVGNDIVKDESADKMYGSCFELCWSKNKHKRDIARVKWAGIFGLEKEPDKKRFHPTQKPIELVEWFLTRYSKQNELVVDLFGGSGSTLIACEKNGRKARVMELDPHYCDVIRRRYTKWCLANNKPLTSGCLDD